MDILCDYYDDVKTLNMCRNYNDLLIKERHMHVYQLISCVIPRDVFLFHLRLLLSMQSVKIMHIKSHVSICRWARTLQKTLVSILLC